MNELDNTPITYEDLHPEDLHEMPTRAFRRMARVKSGQRTLTLKGLRRAHIDDFEYLDILTQEFEILSQLDHPSIPKAVALLDESPIGPCLVEEHLHGPSLDKLLAENPSKDTRISIMRSIIDAIAYVHSQDLCHGDLRPDNVFISNLGMHPWIVDFAIADNAPYSQFIAKRGSDDYTPPEHVAGKLDGKPGDVYALGKILEDMKLGRPFNSIIAKSTAKDPTERPTASDVLKSFDRAAKFDRLFYWILLAIAVVLILVMLFI